MAGANTRKKKSYSSPEIQIYQSLKEVTLADTCKCRYWGEPGIMQSCAFCTNPSGPIVCPNPPSSCTDPF